MKLAHALHRLEGEFLRYAPALHGQRCCGTMQPKPSAVWNTPCRGCVANTAHNNHIGSRPPGFLSYDIQNHSGAAAPSLWIGNGKQLSQLLLVIEARSGEPVKGRRFCASFHFSTDNGKPSNLFTPLIIIGGFQMTEARVGYHKEVKTASFQGKSITVENHPDALSQSTGQAQT